MKRSFFCLTALVLCLNISAQQYAIGIGTDLKILTLGTDNRYTTHSQRFNFVAKFEYIDDRNNYLAVGYSSVDLNIDYQSWWINIGKSFMFIDNIFIVPQFEIGQIIRNGPGIYYDISPLFIASNTALRYRLFNKIIFETSFNLQLARDLPNRTFRYGGLFSVYYILN